MNYFTYVIKSVNSDYVYKGHCEVIEKRLKEHNLDKTRSNKAYLPFEILYFEEFPTRQEAIKREKYFKSASGRRYLECKIKKVP